MIETVLDNIEDTCPKCGSDQILFGKPNFFQEEEVIVKAVCEKCNTKFRNVYNAEFERQDIEK